MACIVECIIFERKAGRKEGFLISIYKNNKPLEACPVDHVGPIEQTSKNCKLWGCYYLKTM